MFTYKYLENKPGIYLIKSKINTKVYVGSSNKVKNRIIKHLSDLKRQIHSSKHLQRAYNKYGINNFTVHILEYTQIDILLKRENWWLQYYTSYIPIFGYNICRYANNTKGRRHSIFSKQLISNNRKGKTVGKNNPFYGKKHDPNFIKKMSDERKITSLGNKNPNYRHDVLNDDILISYKHLKSFKKVAEKFNINKDTIRRRLKPLNIDLKKYKNEIENT